MVGLGQLEVRELLGGGLLEVRKRENYAKMCLPSSAAASYCSDLLEELSLPIVVVAAVVVAVDGSRDLSAFFQTFLGTLRHCLG